MTHITCRLTAENRDQLRNPRLSNRVWATFTFYLNRVQCTTQKSSNAIPLPVIPLVQNRDHQHNLISVHESDEAELLQRLWSGSQQHMIIPRMQFRTISDQSFHVMAAHTWNVHHCSYFSGLFQRQLKQFCSYNFFLNYNLTVYRVSEAPLPMPH